MGYPTKVQLIQRQGSQQWYINFPAPIAQAMEFAKGEVVEWVIHDRRTLLLHRTEVRQDKKNDSLLDAFLDLWEQDMDVFAQHRTWERAARLGLSQLACLGPHTVTGLLWTAGRTDVDWSADYRLFSQDRWDAQRLFDSVARGVLDFLGDDQPLVCALDDTLLRKSGPRIADVAYRRDPLSPPFHVNFVRGQRFLQIAAMLPARAAGPCGGRGIPVRFQPAPPLPKPSARSSEAERIETTRLRRFYNLSTMGRDAIAATRQQLDRQPGGPERTLVMAVDGSYTNQTVLRHLPPRTVLIGRIRKDAKFFAPLQPAAGDSPASPGRPRRYGEALPTPEALRKDESMPWQTVSAFATGQVHAFRIKTLAPALWPKAGADRPLRLIVIAPVCYRLRKGSRLLYRQPAFLICTDPDMPLEQVLQDYLWRWQIELDHRDEKQLIGVGQAQVRNRDAARREPAFAVACYAKLLLAGAKVYGRDATRADLPLPKWRTHVDATRVTTADLLRQLRQELWHLARQAARPHLPHFVTASQPTTKCLKFELSLADAVNHAATG